MTSVDMQLEIVHDHDHDIKLSPWHKQKIRSYIHPTKECTCGHSYNTRTNWEVQLAIINKLPK